MRAWMLALAGVAMIMDFVAPALTTLSEPTIQAGKQTLDGYVCEPAAPGARNTVTFLFCPYEADGNRGGLLHHGAVRVTADGALPRHAIAGALRLELRLKPPVAPLNQGGGGYERWLYQNRILATSELLDRQPLSGQCGLRCRYHRWRINLIHRLETHLSRMRHPELAEALLLGSRARLEERHWEVLEATGTQHLVAISGLHLGLVAMFLGLFLQYPARRLSPRYPRLGRWLPLALVLAGALAYALLAGFTVPTQRALVMVAVAGVIASGGRQWRLWDGWLLAAVLVIVLEPRAVLGMGFWFSFGAVACLILALGVRQAQPSAPGSLLIAQVAVVAGLMPVMLGFGVQPSMLAVPANLVAIPLLSLVVMPLLLMAAPLVLLAPSTAGWVEPGLDLIFRLLWWILESMASLEWSLPAFTHGLALVLAAGILVALGPVGWAYRGAIAASTVVILAIPTDGPGSPKAGAELRFPDGFGGPVALLRHEGKAMLFDARSPAAGYRDRTRDRVFPWLEALGVNQLDAVVLSHPGVEPDSHWNFREGPGIRRLLQADACNRVDELSLPGIRLVPWRDPRGRTLTRAEQACNLILRTGDFSAVLFGPIKRSGERRLLKSLDAPDAIDLVLAPRGGAGDSSQLGLIQALSPRWAVLTPRNWSPGDPPPALGRYRQAETTPLVTSRTGELTVTLDASGARLEKARATTPWHSPL